ncbi:MAG: hypothetical protein K2X77_13185 [Candidatus Obscuribacterales bacterium]|nr:hypothetical protein [Candidatus Obscuribacterales bacterium]
MNPTIDKDDTATGALSDKVATPAYEGASALANEVLSWEETKRSLRLELTGAACKPVNSLVDRLDSLIQLPPNWDSHGARAVAFNAAMNTIRLFCEVMFVSTPQPQVVPTNKGNLQLEWHQCGIDLEIEVSNTGEVHAFFEDLTSGADPDEWTESFNFAAHKIRSYLQILTERGVVAPS